MKFRTDINGLRAFAVIFVVLFHFGIPPFNGGFIGVDIFFVISGYLMTRIILEKLNAGSFSILSFYFARCKRIIPPLIFLCIVILLLGYFFIPPVEYAKLSKHVTASLVFMSNMLYYRESGYFDLASKYKWLLHTWSLSVEWQFYVVLPFLLVAINKFFKEKLSFFLLAIFIFSFLLALYLSKIDDSLSYFFFGSRAWEMIAGGLAYLYSKESASIKTKRYVIHTCLFLLLVSAVFIDSSISWPGAWTLLPVVSTAVIISTNGDIPFLKNKLIQAIGLWSYSIYLYHWPVLVAAGIFWENRTISLNLSLVLVSIILGWLSYSLIESKERVMFKLFSRKIVIFPVAVVVTVVSLTIFKFSGFPAHGSDRVNYLSAFSGDLNINAKECFVIDASSSPECKFGPKKSNDNVDLVIIGDSHAYATLSAVIESNKNKSIVFIAGSSCPTIPNIERVTRPQCGEFMENAFQSILKKYTNASVLIVSRFSQYLHSENGSKKGKVEFLFDGKPAGINEFSANLLKAINFLGSGRKIFILSPIPDYPYDVIFYMSRKAVFNDNDNVLVSIDNHRERSGDINRMLSEISEKKHNVQILNVDEYLCDDTYCYGSKNGVPLYRDNNHFSETGNKILVPLFKKIWN